MHHDTLVLNTLTLIPLHAEYSTGLALAFFLSPTPLLSPLTG